MAAHPDWKYRDSVKGVILAVHRHKWEPCNLYGLKGLPFNLACLSAILKGNLKR